jgi:maltose phosphorylase
MKQYLKHHEWQIIEEGLNPHYNKVSESVFSLGNGRMGQRATFEEDYSGETHQGSYVWAGGRTATLNISRKY